MYNNDKNGQGYWGGQLFCHNLQNIMSTDIFKYLWFQVVKLLKIQTHGSYSSNLKKRAAQGNQSHPLGVHHVIL